MNTPVAAPIAKTSGQTVLHGNVPAEQTIRATIDKVGSLWTDPPPPAETTEAALVRARALLNRLLNDSAGLHAEAAAGQWVVPSELDVAAWADAHRWLSPEDAPAPGKWDVTRAEYQRDPMQAMSDPAVRQVVLRWSAQVGKTSCLLNAIGFYIHVEPCPMLWVSTTVGEVESFAKTRFSAFRRDNPLIASRVQPTRGGPGDNRSTLDEQRFPGGRLLFRGSNAPAGLRGNPIRVLILDEVDGYPYATAEGEPTAIAMKRVQVYEAAGLSKIIMASTPASTLTSRIGPAYAASDRRRYHVPCPHCGELQTLVENVAEFMQFVRWDKTSDGEHLPATAALHCKHCGAAWSEGQRLQAVREGRWIADRPEITDIRGYWINEFYSPFSSLPQIVRGFLKSHGEPRRFQQWVNLTLGIEWEDTVEAQTGWRTIYDRREDYEIGVVPARVRLVTAGVDVQGDRLELEIVGWNERFESWSIDYRVLRGDPRKDEIWQDLDRVLEERFPGGDGGMYQIACMAVDAGYATDAVEKWVVKHSAKRVIATRGEAMRRLDFPIGRPKQHEIQLGGPKRRRRIVLYPLGVDWMKSELLHGWLKQQPPTEEQLAEGTPYPEGYCHFPRAYGQSYFEGLCSEKLVLATGRSGVT